MKRLETTLLLLAIGLIIMACCGCVTTDCVVLANREVVEHQRCGRRAGVMLTKAAWQRKGHAVVWWISESGTTFYYDPASDMSIGRPRFVKWVCEGEYK